MNFLCVLFWNCFVRHISYHIETRRVIEGTQGKRASGRRGRDRARWDPNSRDTVIYCGSFIEHYLQSVDKHDSTIFFSVCFNKNHQIIKSGFGSWKCVFSLSISLCMCACVFKNENKVEHTCVPTTSSHAIQINQHCSIHFRKNRVPPSTKYY